MGVVLLWLGMENYVVKVSSITLAARARLVCTVWNEQLVGRNVWRQAAWEGVSSICMDYNALFYSCIDKSLYNILSTMPRVASSNKQKNRKFKGSAKGAKKALVKTKSKTKGINKLASAKPKTNKVQRLKQEKERKTKEVEKLAAVNEYLDTNTKGSIVQKLKGQNQIRIVLLVPCNEHANVAEMMNTLAQYIETQDGLTLRKDLKACTAFPAFQVFPAANRSPIRNRLFIIAANRQPRQLLDLAKCADIVIPVVSVLSANPQRIVEDPYNYAGAFDQAGYATINMLRSLGLPRVIGLIQHLQKLEHKHHDKILKFYRRFLNSQFGEEKFLAMQSVNDISTLLRTCDSCGLSVQQWQHSRGYILADQVETNSNGSVVVSGFVKGNCINTNQLVHVTGFDDYQIESIEIQTLGVKTKLVMDVEDTGELVQYSTMPEQLNPFSKPETLNEEGDILTALQGLEIEKHEPQQEEEAIQDEMNEEASENEEDWQWEADEVEDEKAEEKARRLQMQMRTQDELQFEDEVEYAAQQLLRERYREYQGLKSFKTSQWNQLENLPNQYDRIYFFKHYNKTHQAAYKDNMARGFAYPGFYVRITIKQLDAQRLSSSLEKLPLVLSFLLKHERKMTVLHGKIQKNRYYEGEHQIKSEELVMVSIGFKRLLINPIYSRCINGTEKTKYIKAIKEDYENYYYCSFYGLNQFPPSPFLVFRVNHLFPDQVEPAPILRGDLVACNPNHVILERIILTGYPYKINRRRSTVRYMFFNPSDVKYFKPVQVRTKMGLRGKIQESLGTHGLMKCLFNDPIKHNDVVCMHLYRRVYPPADF